MSCFQLTVGGSGSAKPDTVKFPGAYGVSDPGILINIYTTIKNYQIPGPKVWSGFSKAARRFAKVFVS